MTYSLENAISIVADQTAKHEEELVWLRRGLYVLLTVSAFNTIGLTLLILSL